MKIQYTRSAGLPGLFRSCELDTEKLPADLAKRLKDLLEQSGFDRSVALVDPKGRDKQQFTLRIKRRGKPIDITVDASQVPDNARELLRLLEEHAKPGLL